MSEWVKCSDKLPPEGQYVYGAVYGTDVIIQQDGETLQQAFRRTAICNPRVRICQWCGEEDGWWTNHGMMVVQPLFWMEIPQQTPPAITEKDVFDE